MKEQVVLFVLLSLLRSSYSVVVDCPDQSVSCECPEDATECEFTFRIEERFSFVTHPLTPEREVTEAGGSLYFLNSTGFHPTSQSSASSCYIGGTIIRDETFTDNGCSVPMTLDGVNYRTLLLINGRIPGPTLVVYVGQIVVVHVVNKLESIGITIHWHGMFQQGSVWMDGVGFISQAPLDAAGATFDYIFLAEPSGTHWYHSHIGSQKSDGLFGGLVVLERQSLGTILGDSKYDAVIERPAGEYTLTLIDWQRKEEATVLVLNGLEFYPELPLGVVPTDQDTAFPANKYFADGAFIGLFPFWSGLINGRGRKESSTLTPLSIFSVERNSIYHFRLVGSISIFALRVSIDGHKLMAIASDGEYFEPTEVDYIIIHTGETYDFLLEANQPDTNFWIRAETLEVLPPGTEHSARAILTYGDSSDLDWTTGYSNVIEVNRQCTTASPCKVLNCPFENYPTSDLQCVHLTSLIGLTGTPESEIPRYPPNASCPDCNHFLNFGFEGKDFDSSVNARSFELPPLAYATNCFEYEREKDDSTSDTCNNCVVDPQSSNGGCECVQVIPVANQEIYDPSTEPQSIALVFSSKSVDLFSVHPIHLHGHSFHVVYIGYGEYNSTNGQIQQFTTDIDCGNPTELCVNPQWANGIPQGVRDRTENGRVVSSAIRKDTVIIPSGGYVVVAFQANNPGYWIMHCHIELHLLQGMAVVVQEYSSGQQWAPPDGINLHGSFKWTVDDYRETLNRSETCDSQLTQPPPTEALILVDELCVSRAGFGIAMAIIGILFIVVLILVVVVLIMRFKETKFTPTTASEGTAAKGDIPMSEVYTRT